VNAELGFLSDTLWETLKKLDDRDVIQSARDTGYLDELKLIQSRMANLHGAVTDLLAARVAGGRRD
jgi:hypothetical protein